MLKKIFLSIVHLFCAILILIVGMVEYTKENYISSFLMYGFGILFIVAIILMLLDRD
jgi:hypothetical protein